MTHIFTWTQWSSILCLELQQCHLALAVVVDVHFAHFALEPLPGVPPQLLLAGVTGGGDPVAGLLEHVDRGGEGHHALLAIVRDAPDSGHPGGGVARGGGGAGPGVPPHEGGRGGHLATLGDTAVHYLIHYTSSTCHCCVVPLAFLSKIVFKESS